MLAPSYLQSIDLARLLSETPHKMLAQIQTPLFLSQLGGIVVSFVLAYWLSKRAHVFAAHWTAASAHKTWGKHLARLVDYIALPLSWLVLLWLGAVAAIAIDVPLHIVGAAIDLVFAWICIRLLSSTVSSNAAAIAISLVAWTIAALNILDLYRPLSAWMSSVHVYDGKTHHVSLFDAASALFLLVLLLWLTRLLYSVLQRQIVNAQSLTPSLQVLFSQLLQILLPSLAVVIALQTVGLDLTTLTVAFGAIGLGVGLGLQRIVANLVAGLSLLLGKTIKPGDVLAYKETYGSVTGMGARYVTLRTLGGVEHLIPNDYFLENGVENWSYSDAKLALKATVGISYDCDPHEAIAICVDAIRSVKRVLSEPQPLVVVKEFGDSAIALEMYFWIEDPRSGIASVKSDVLLAVWDRFKEVGISIPYPQREVHVIGVAPTPSA